MPVAWCKQWERPELSVKQEGNGGHKLSPEAIGRIEAALESERRQREQLERRLQETERRLEKALAAVGAGTPDTTLLELKSQIAGEMQAQADRARLELNLLELELVANASAEASATPATPLPPRIIQYVNVPAPEAKQAAPAAAAPKDYEDKLAAAQMAIDAAEARASHNAVQVRKLTEELAAARSEQIRLSSEVRDLCERFDVPKVASKPKAKKTASRPEPKPEPAAIFDEPAPSSPRIHLEEIPPTTLTPADESPDLAAALEDWGGAAEMEAAPHTVERSEDAGLEDALQGWGEVEEEQKAASGDDELADALQAWGDAVEVPGQPKDASDSDTSDSLVSALEGWGDPNEEPSLPEPEGIASGEEAIEEEAEAWAEALEVDTVSRLNTPDTPVETRVMEALHSDMDGDGLLDESEEMSELEESGRWEPTAAAMSDEEAEVLADWGPEPGERIAVDLKSSHDFESLETAEIEPAMEAAAAFAPASAVEPEPEFEMEFVTETPAEEQLVSHAAYEETPFEVEPAREQVAEFVQPSSTLDELESAQVQREARVEEETPRRRAVPPPLPPEVLEEQSDVEDEAEEYAASAEDFEPDMAAMARRRVEPERPPVQRATGRDAMINALQQFIGE